MPRVNLNKRKYKISDFSKWLKGEMFAQGLTQTYVAAELGTSQQNFSKKLKSSDFSYKELLTIFQLLQTDDLTICRLMKESK